MSATPRLVHTVLQTAQPEAMRNWYRRVLDGHVVHGLTFITFDEEHHPHRAA